MSLIENIRGYARKLKKASQWENSKTAIGYVESSTEKDYEFEFYVYARILFQLSHKYQLRYIAGNGSDPHKFPQKAALKENMPRFEVYDDGVKVFQVCTGTRISCDLDSEKNHPDISFQLPYAPEKPVASDLIMIFDAKFQEKAGSKLSKTEFYKFPTILRFFDLESGPRKILDLGPLNPLVGNTLITNELAHNDDPAAAVKLNIKEVQFFRPGSHFEVKG
jgi:hypothetical protein